MVKPSIPEGFTFFYSPGKKSGECGLKKIVVRLPARTVNQ